MGCCVSSPTTQKAQAFESKSPPPLEDQETDIVKEVLPVTPKPPQQEEGNQQKPIKKPLQELDRPDRKPYIELTKNVKRFRAEEETTLSEQEASEACSFSACSESLSTTTTITNPDATTPISNYKRHNVNAKTEDRFYGISRHHHHQELKQRVVRSPSPASRTRRIEVGNRAYIYLVIILLGQCLVKKVIYDFES